MAKVAVVLDVQGQVELKVILSDSDAAEALRFLKEVVWAQIQAQVQLKADVHVYADGLSDEELRRALFTPCRSIEETVARLRSERPGAAIAVLPDGPQTVPYIGV